MSSEKLVHKRTLDVGGHQIAVVENSAAVGAPAVVLLHGITMSVNFWPAVVNGHRLQDCHWISVSLPGHFPSTAPDLFSDSDVSPQLFAGVVRTAITEVLGGQPAHLVGWSTGGFAAIATAAIYPELVSSVVSISGFARGQWGHLLGIMQRLAGNGAGRLFYRAGMSLLGTRKQSLQLILNRFAGQRFATSHHISAIEDAAFHDFRQHDLTVMACLFAGLHRTSIADLLSGIEVPTRVIGGQRDPVISIEETRFLADLIPNADRLELQGKGHLFYAEACEQVLDSAFEWITRHHKA
jgi:pimeloyl-ACP methyl ester carboxylesterase